MLPSSPVLRPFRYLRQALPWLLALAVATCTADQGGPSTSGTGYFSFRPVYHLAGGASLSQFGIVADSVRIRLTRPVDQVVLDTALFFPPDSTSLHLALPVELQQSPETLTAIITISAGGTVIFTDSIDAEVKDGPPGSSPPPTVTFKYVGPGSKIASITILPPDTNVFFGDTLFFTASAIDSSDANVPSFYVGWKTSDTTVAKINANGRFIAPAARGSVRVVGMTPTGIADTTLVSFSPVPVIVTADSGNAQSGLVGDSLAVLFVARVKGADSLGIAGIPVKFAAVTAGGAVRDTFTLITDATGRVRTRGVLGTVTGAYSYTATAVGTALPVATFTGSAGSAAAAAISIAQGNGQVDTIGKTLGLPLGVNVRDAFGNPVGGAMVVFTRTAGSGTVGNDTVLTAVDGDASTTYTLGPVAGTDSIKAQLAGTSAFVVFTATAVSNTPASIIQGLGGGQTAVAGTPFTDSLTVQVLDINDNPIAGVQVHWAVTLGSVVLSADSTPTDLAGHAAIAVTAGTAVGPVTIAATVTGVASPVNFSEAVTPAAPAVISLVSGNGQSANPLTVLPLPLVVHVVDGFGNPVPGVAVAFTVTAGGGTIDSATATTNIVGNANSGSWTLGATAGVDTVIATSAAVPADTVFFTATTLPAGTSKVWTAAVNNSWSTAGNWNPAGVPTSADNVFIPAGVSAPVLGAASSANDLTVAAGTTLNTGTFTLTASGNVDVAGSIQGTGTLAANGTGKTFRGTFLVSTLNTTGTLTLNGPTQINSAYTLGAGSLTVGGQTLTLNNGLTVNGSGVLVMTNAADSVDVFGNATFASGTSSTGSLTNGIIVYHGNFTQTAGAFTNYDASPGHRTRFFAFTLQTISFTNPSPANSHFGSVEFANGVGEILATNIAATGTVLVTGGNVTGSGRTAFLTGDLISPPANWFLTTTEWSVAPTQYPDSILGSLNVVGPWTLTHALEVGGTLTVNNGGTLTVGGQALRVVGALNVPNGQLVMNNAADSVDVGGNATFSSGTSGTGLLSAGVLVLRGNFTQTAGAFTNFAPSGTHKTRFLGTLGQTITFSTPGSANSRFQDLEFGDPAGVTLGSTVTAMGTTTVSAGTVTGLGRTINLGGDLLATYANWQVSTTLWGASPTVYPDSLPRNVTVFNGFTLNKPFKVDSNLIINSTGVLTLNGNTLRVGGSFTQGGVLRMQNTADTLVIGGLFTVNSGISGVGDLTGGLLRIRGGMNQTAGAFANFQAAGTHTTRFEAGSGQGVAFTSAGVANSRFQNLELADSVNATSNLYVAGDVTLLTGGKLVGIPTITLAGNLTDPTDLGWRASSTLLNGTPAFLPDSMVTNLQLSGTWTVGRRTVVDGNLTITSSGVLALNADTVRVTGGLTQTGTLTMLSPNDLLDVGGLFTVNGAVGGTGSLSNGLLILRNGFNQTAGSFSNFQPSGTHTVRFAGTGGHGVSFTSPGTANSRFQNVEILDSLTLSTAMTVMGTTTLDPAGRVLGANTATLLGDLVDPSKKGWRVANTSVPGTQALPDTMATNLTVAGNWTLATGIDLTGNFAIASTGVVALNGHRMHVSANVTQGGRLQMLLASDTLDVGGTFLVNSSATGVGDITDGRLLLHGGFTQTAGSFTNFAPSAAHLTAFLGSGGHAVSFTSADNVTQSHFHQLEVHDSLAVTGTLAASGTVTIDSIGRVAGIGTAKLLGALVDSSLAGWRMGTTQLDGKFQPIPSALVTDLVVRDSQFLAQPTTVTGNMSLTANGYLGFGGHGLGVSGNFTQNAQLAMNSSGDSLEVGGNFLVNGSSADTMTAGVIVLHGGFNQTSGSFTNYVSVAPHRTRFTGPAARSIDFTAPNNSMFGDLEVDATGVITLGGNFHVTGTFKKPAGPVSPFTAVAQRVLQVNGLAVDGASFDRVRIQLNANVNALQFDNVAFTNQDLTQTQLSLELPGLAGDTLKLNSVAFDGVPTTGRYVYVTDSVPDGAVATVAFYNSTPLNGSLYAAVNGAAGDVPSVLWSSLAWLTQPLAGTELLPFVPAPQLRAVDPSGNLIAGFTGTVTLGLSTDPSAGTAVLAGNSVAAVGGIATFDSLTLSLAGVGYQLQANAGGLGQGPPSAPFTISVPLPVGTSTAFTNGGGDNDWFNAANWTAGVPDSADNVFVFPGQTATVNSPATVNRVTIGTGGTIVLNAPLRADSSISAGNTISGGGQLIAQGNGTLSGVVGDLQITGNYTVDPTGQLSATSITVGGAGVLDLNGRRVDVTGNFGINGNALLKMTDPKDSLFVNGNFLADGDSTAGLLSAGTLTIGGDFEQGATTASNSFRAAAGHTTRFVGPRPVHRIHFNTPVQPADPFSTNFSQFGRLELIEGDDSVASTIPVAADLFVDSASVIQAFESSGGPAVAGNVQVGPNAREFTTSNLSLGGVLDFQPAPSAYAVGTTLFFGASQTIPNLPYQSIEVDLGQATLSSDLTVQDVRTGIASEGPGFPGDLRLGGHKLTVLGNFTTVGLGTFTMDDPADSLDVTGNMDLGGGVTTALTAGTLVARGDMYLQDSNFVASGTHRTVFAAPSSQQLWITTSPVPSNQFNFVTIPLGTTVQFNAFSVGPMVVKDSFAINGFFVQAAAGKTVIALGDLYAGTAAGITVDTVELHKSLDIDASTYSTQLTRYAGVGQIVSATTGYHDLEITGTATLDSTVFVSNDASIRGAGVLDMAGHALEVTHDLTVADSGLLVMTSAADSMNVGYTATFDGRDSEGWLTAGTLTFNYFKQLATTSLNSFRATGTHRAVLREQNPDDLTEMVQFATPGATASQFQEFELNGAGGFAYFGAGAIYVADSLYVPAGGSGGLFGSGTSMTVAGPIAVQTGTIPIQLDTLELRGTIQVPYSSLGNGVTRFAGINQQIPDTQNYNRVEITGTASLETGGGLVTASDAALYGSGRLTLGPNMTFISLGGFSTAGTATVAMTDPTSALLIHGTADFKGGSTEGLLAAGTMTLFGDLNELGATSDSAFRPSQFGFTTQFDGDLRHHVTMGTQFDVKSYLTRTLVTDNDTLDVNDTPLPFFGRVDLQNGAALVNSGATQPFVEVLGVFTAGPGALVQLDNLGFRDTVLVDPASTYNVGTTFFGYYALPLPVLPYQSIHIQGGTPFLGANIAATGWVSVNGQGTSADLRLNGFTLHAENFETMVGGTLTMDQANDSLVVDSTAFFHGGSELGKLVAGAIAVGGDFTQDTGFAQSPSGFVSEGTTVDLALDTPHKIHFATPDSSWLPTIFNSGAGILQMQFAGRTRIAGSLNAYGLALTGDTLWVDGQVSGGAAGANATLTMLRTGSIYGGTSFSTYAVGTTQFTDPGSLLSLPYDTLVVSDTLLGSYSQVVTANQVIVTGPGNPLHVGATPGWLYLQGGDGNTTITVNGDAIVSGAGAAIFSNFGTLTTTGDLVVDQGGVLVATTGGCCGLSLFDIGGNATFTGASLRDSLISGQLVVGKNFVQGGPDPESFVADSGFTTTFTGPTTHSVTFATPTAAGGGGSHFGSLSFSSVDASQELNTSTDLWVEGTLTTTSYVTPTLRSTAGALRTLNVRDVSIQGITFDHLQLHLAKNALPAAGTGNMDIVNFTNFLTTEDQFLVDLPGQPGGFSWSNFTFTQLDTLGGDTGRYIVANDNDGGTPDILTISLGGSQISDPAIYFEALGGAVINLFAP